MLLHGHLHSLQRDFAVVSGNKWLVPMDLLPEIKTKKYKICTHKNCNLYLRVLKTALRER